jgi:hypothetical protein
MAMTVQPLSERDDPAAFIEALFGMEEKGFVVLAFIPYGGGAATHAHIPVGRWDIAGREIAHHAPTHNCYVATALYATPARKVAGRMQHRTKEMIGHCRWLYADLDGARPPASLPEPTILIETSPGRLQAWWQLGAPVNVRRAEDLMRRVASACGIGNEAVDATRILRIPGTPNRKAGRDDATVRRIGGSGAIVPDAPFAALPMPSYATSGALVGPVAHVTVDADALRRGTAIGAANDVPPYLARLLRGENPGHDPSSGDHATVCGLMEMGMSDAEAYAVFLHSPRGGALVERKGENRIEYLMDRLVSRARAKIGGDGTDAETASERPQALERRYRLYTATEIKERPMVTFRVEGLIPEGALCALIGNPGTYKTFVALDLALCIATGTAWHGRDVVQGRVVFVSAEGAAGLGQRISAWERKHWVTVDDEQFRVITDAPQLLDGADVETLVVSITEAMETPDGIFIDTLARTFDGEENSSQDMGAYIRALDRLRTTFTAFVCPIHHLNKAGISARGSSAFFAALDVEVTMTRELDAVQLAITKAKEFSEGEPMILTPERVDVGKHVASLVLVAGDLKVSTPSADEQRVLSILVDVFGSEGVTQSRWEKAVMETGMTDARFARARRILVDRGWVNGPPKGTYVRGFRYSATPEGVKVFEGVTKVSKPSAHEGVKVSLPLSSDTLTPSSVRGAAEEEESDDDDLF